MNMMTSHPSMACEVCFAIFFSKILVILLIALCFLSNFETTQQCEIDIYAHTVSACSKRGFNYCTRLIALPEDSCSYAPDDQTCAIISGYGASGRCVWRHGDNDSSTLTAEYSTCSPDLAHCPDRHCDELEVMVPLLCPQDCARTYMYDYVTIQCLHPVHFCKL